MTDDCHRMNRDSIIQRCFATMSGLLLAATIAACQPTSRPSDRLPAIRPKSSVPTPAQNATRPKCSSGCGRLTSPRLIRSTASPRPSKSPTGSACKSIKRNDMCVRCHYTVQTQDGRARVVAGVSCESCHGAAADWIAIHADYGGPTSPRQPKRPSTANSDMENSIAHGMNNPHNVYLIAKQCYNCHTVPNEQAGERRRPHRWQQGLRARRLVARHGAAQLPPHRRHSERREHALPNCVSCTSSA